MKNKLMLTYNLRSGKVVKYGHSNRKLRWAVEIVATTGDEEVSLEFTPNKPVKIFDLEAVINEEINSDSDIFNADEVEVRIYLP